MARTRSPLYYGESTVEVQVTPYRSFKSIVAEYERARNSANPIRKLADSINRCLGRYPMMWASMAWPIVSDTEVASENLGSAPFANFSRYDEVKNGRTATVRVSSFISGSNSGVTGESYLTIQGPGDGFSNAETPPTLEWSSNRSLCEDVSYDELSIDRGAETNTWLGYQINTYGGFNPLEIVIQDDDIQVFDTNTDIHEYVESSKATTFREVTSEVPNSMRERIRSFRKTQHGHQAMWMGTYAANVPQYPQETNRSAIVTNSNTYVNLMNQAWTERNSESPGIECIAQYRARGAQRTPEGTTVPCTFRALVESNAAGPAGPASIEVRGPMGSASFQVPANTIAEYSINLGLNSAYDPINVSNGVNKLDVFGKVSNSGTDSLLLRWFVVKSFTD